MPILQPSHFTSGHATSRRSQLYPRRHANVGLAAHLKCPPVGKGSNLRRTCTTEYHMIIKRCTSWKWLTVIIWGLQGTYRTGGMICVTCLIGCGKVGNREQSSSSSKFFSGYSHLSERGQALLITRMATSYHGDSTTQLSTFRSAEPRPSSIHLSCKPQGTPSRHFAGLFPCGPL